MANVIIKKVVIRDRHFTIVKDEVSGAYCGIEDKYITNGRLNRSLNGFQMHASKDLNMCLECTKDAVDIDYLKSTGLSKDEAFKVWYETKYGVQLQA